MCLSQSHPQYIRPWTFKGTIASCLEALYPLSKAPCCCCVPGMRSGGMTVGVAKAAGGEWALPAPGAGRRAAGGAIVHEYHCACPGQGAAAQRRGGGICACDFACHVYVRAAPPCHASMQLARLRCARHMHSAARNMQTTCLAGRSGRSSQPAAAGATAPSASRCVLQAPARMRLHSAMRARPQPCAGYAFLRVAVPRVR